MVISLHWIPPFEMVFHVFQGHGLIPCFGVFCFGMGEDHVEGVSPSYCVGHYVARLADPNEIRR